VPSPEGTRICPSAHGAANWYSTSYSPHTGFYYVQTLENCNIFVKSPAEWVALKSYWGGSTKQAADAPNQKILRAIDVGTGKIAWELPQPGPGGARGGTMVTATGVLFFCDDQDRFVAVDAQNGAMLWQFQTNSVWRASPMAYQFDGQQRVAIASGSNVIVFGLVE
jgi:alcohol dehydrogenase (cytochrome c)